MGTNKYILILLGMVSCIYSLPEGRPREGRFSIFQIIKFENGNCEGSTRSGTCFTEQECESNGGTKDGTCADGFGVCCIKTISDGETSSLNMTVISSTGRKKRQASTVVAGAQKFTICPSSEDICRIRFDFTTLVLAAPVTDPGTLADGDAGNLAIQGPSIGDCVEDQFSITSSGSAGTPIICGTNSGQHMIVDSDGIGCSDVNIAIGSANVARSWDITVLQFRCGDELGGPSGCLQWFTEPTGSIRSFNFPVQANGAAVAANVVHLSNQDYNACLRRPAGTATVCFLPCTFVDPAGGQSSFGVSKSSDAAAKSGVEADCDSDWIEIRGGADVGAAGPSTNTRFCGRELNAATATAWAEDNASLCTNLVPFEVHVHFDDDEVQADGGDCSEAETACNPGGIIGFSLCYTTL